MVSYLVLHGALVALYGDLIASYDDVVIVYDALIAMKNIPQVAQVLVRWTHNPEVTTDRRVYITSYSESSNVP